MTHYKKRINTWEKKNRVTLRSLTPQVVILNTQRAKRYGPGEKGKKVESGRLRQCILRKNCLQDLTGPTASATLGFGFPWSITLVGSGGHEQKEGTVDKLESM